jgi:hypothetical protein
MLSVIYNKTNGLNKALLGHLSPKRPKNPKRDAAENLSMAD